MSATCTYTLTFIRLQFLFSGASFWLFFFSLSLSFFSPRNTAPNRSAVALLKHAQIDANTFIRKYADYIHTLASIIEIIKCDLFPRKRMRVITYREGFCMRLLRKLSHYHLLIRNICGLNFRRGRVGGRDKDDSHAVIFRVSVPL